MTRLRWLAHGTMLTMLMSAAMATHAQSRDSASDAQAAGLDKNKLSYAIGYQIGSQFANGDPDVDIAVMQRAIQDAYGKRRPSVPMQDMHEQLGTTTASLSQLPYESLCPGSAELEKLQQRFR